MSNTFQSVCGNSLRAGLCSALLLMSLVPAFGEPVGRIELLEAREISKGSRIVIIANSPLANHSSYLKGNRFYLELRQVSLPDSLTPLRGSAFDQLEISARDGSVVLSCRMLPGVRVKVLQSRNLVQVFFYVNKEQLMEAVATKSPATVVDISAPASANKLKTLQIPRLSETPGIENHLNGSSGSLVTKPATVADVSAEPLPTNLKTLRIPRVNEAPAIEDYLNGSNRGPGVAVTDFLQVTPADGKAVTKPTKVFLSYDDSSLYVIFICRDEPGKVRAHLSRREEISGDDYVSVTLDTFRDKRRAYTFLVNPLGVQLDGILTEGQETDYTFDTVWRSEGRLINDGYVVLLAIPFKSMRFSGAPVQTWGIALGRTIVRLSETAYWPQITYNVQGFTPQMATLKGLKQISPGRNIELRPYAAFTGARTLEPVAQGPYTKKNKFRGGVDSKIVFRDALTLDLTVNPDFSHVESDEPQVLVNQRFEVFFPEKRPFFIENAGFFQTPETLFFSRRIVDPQFGARLTGKQGRWGIGALVIDDRAAGEVDGSGPSDAGKRAVIGVVRLQREFGEQSHFGVLVTSHDHLQSSNRVLAADVRWTLNPNWTFTGQAAQSTTRELDGSRSSGSVYLASLNRSGRSFNYDVTYTDRSPGFHTRLGFVPRVDVRQVEQFASYRWHPGSERVLSYGPSGYLLLNWDRQGRLQDWHASASFAAELTRQTSVNVDHSQSYELLEGQGFHTHNSGIWFSTDPLDWLGLSGSYSSGSTVNYFPGPGLQPFEASSANGGFGLTLRPGSRLSLSQNYIYRRLGVTRNMQPLYAGGESIFNNHISRSKINYQYNRKLSLRFILDYNAVLPNENLVALEREKQITYDILATYLVNPGTAFYVGYGDRYENFLITPTETLRFGSPTRLSSRQFFMKLSYLFRY